MIFSKEINQIAAQNRVRDTQIEKDYVLTWLLFGISKSAFLRDALIFKGGTVLKKAWFSDYRFSEDLDFTLSDDIIQDKDMLSAFDTTLDFVRKKANLLFQLPPEKMRSHESGSLQLYLDYAGPLRGQLGSRDLKIDITRGEIIETEVVERSIFREYSDLEEDFTLRCYSLAEVLIEKMSALMGRTEPRDLYDFWYLTEIERLNVREYLIDFHRKAAKKGHDPSDFFEKILKKEPAFRRDWENKLRSQIHDLPPFETVFREAKRHFKSSCL
jgi:uncharacterized protein